MATSAPRADPDWVPFSPTPPYPDHSSGANDPGIPQKAKGPGRGALSREELAPSPALRKLSRRRGRGDDHRQSSGTSSSATMLMILISGLMAGPAVSL
jgi:hypothetical protein